MRELHENRELEKIFTELSAQAIDIDDYALVQEESVTGEKLPSQVRVDHARARRPRPDAHPAPTESTER
jgi:hypothetical protein